MQKLIVDKPSVLCFVEFMDEELRKYISLNFPMYHLSQLKETDNGKSHYYFSNHCNYCGNSRDDACLPRLPEGMLSSMAKASKFHKIDIKPSFSFKASYVPINTSVPSTPATFHRSALDFSGLSECRRP